jgi:acetyl/propionyl-CoA carboxylase alpha subunit
MTISKILVANRGEIARRVVRTAREMGIATVAVYSDPDNGEPHMMEADEAVRLAGAGSTETYLNIEAILSAAEETGADAVHPGYGFLSENADFARAVTRAGVTWIGPSPHSIEVMGSKLESKRLMASVGVPILTSIELEGPPDTTSVARELGFPLLVKPSAGGGGKGMRVVISPDDLLEAIEGARREAASSFGDDTVFLEKYLEAPRHIEIQVFGDTHGNLVSLFERECSIQRRHQKIIEESPSTAIDETTRIAMSEAAIGAARAVDYVGAGTVEFLYQDGNFHFLEMNTRLQVEHPVTEMVTGWDLVRLQIEVAAGESLPEQSPTMTGHAIEARLYAEDPLNDFLPVTGKFHRFAIPVTDGLRVDSGIEDGSRVSVHYDPMIAKVIAHAPTREEAAAILATALRESHIHGSTTNVALLVRVLEHPDFLEGKTDTQFLDRLDPNDLGQPLNDPPNERLAALAAALADQAHERLAARTLATIQSGWRNSPSQLQRRTYIGYHGEYQISYSVDPNGFAIGGIGMVVVTKASPDFVSFAIDGVELQYQTARYGDDRYVHTHRGPAHFTAVPRFPDSGHDEDAGSLHAPIPGKVIRVDVGKGDQVVEGQILVVIEAMKMEHALRSPHNGTVVDVRHRAGDQIEADTVLVVVEEG